MDVWAGGRGAGVGVSMIRVRLRGIKHYPDMHVRQMKNTTVTPKNCTMIHLLLSYY